jgi:putative PIN family toxin of toxin-antitoxin system
LRAVLDTNILVSALVFPGGVPESVYRLALDGRLSLVTSPALLAELGRVLSDKFDWEPDRTEEAVSQVARLADVVRPEATVHAVSADPSDDRLMEAAAAGGADVIVSGDHHLLELRTWRGIEVVRAVELMERQEG